MMIQAKGRTATLLTLAALLLTAAPPAVAAVEDGISAYQAKEFEAAIAELKPLADQGNPQAQYYVGGMYAHGEGTLRNYSMAHTYLTLAANQGMTEALQVKGEISNRMSQRDIVESLQRQNEMLLAQQAGVQEALTDGNQVATSRQRRDEEVAVATTGSTDTRDDIAGMDQRTITRNIQQELNRLGYSAGTPDGLSGPSTRTAIQAYQRDTGLETDGEVSADLLRALRAARPG
ncbi:MAG: hypothetical protein RLY86_1849 [Pseudomonadota bacterium]|jgi:hypothetical protein